MPLLKNGELADDPWIAAPSGETPPRDQPAIVDFDYWRAQRNQLIGRNQPLGLRLAPDQSLDDIADDINRFSLIALEFPTFTDGRSYSLARLLRERFGYRGELRAVGNVLRDQFSFLYRCGFDAFEISDTTTAEDWRTALSEMNLRYQSAADGATNTVFHLRQRKRDGERKASQLAKRYEQATGIDLVRALVENEFLGRIVAVSSFGAEAAVLLDLVAQVDRNVPVVFLETGKHFPETHTYREDLITHLGLKDVRLITPDAAALRHEDPDGDLWQRNPDRCCYLRKVQPLERALDGFDAWLTGRKRYQGDVRADLPLIEAADGRVKINPLAGWSQVAIDDWMVSRGLPRHPLGDLGYLSIGCAPCTEVSTSSADPRDGRWAGSEKTECGIHSAQWAR